MAPSSGGSSSFENVGNLTNKGWELGINANPIQKKISTGRLYGSINSNKNLVTASSQIAPITLANNGGSPSVILAGYPVGAFFGNYFVRDANGNLSLDAGGRPMLHNNYRNQLARKVIGDPNPDWVLSLSNNFDYKKLVI